MTNPDQNHSSTNDISTSDSTYDKSYPCPRCQKLTSWRGNPYKPFCSDRCKLIDLGAWANEEYRVPTQDA